jgi:hypothetical protein
MYVSNRSIILALLLGTFMSACNPFQQAKEAVEAKKTSDSLLQEFKKVNAGIVEANRRLKNQNDSTCRASDSLLITGDSGVGAFRHSRK